GVIDRNFTILKGTNNLNTAFELRPSIHFITNRNSAKYLPSDVPITLAKHSVSNKITELQKDTFLIVSLIYNHHLQNFSNLLEKDPDIPKGSLTPSQEQLLMVYAKRYDTTLVFNKNPTLEAIL